MISLLSNRLDSTNPKGNPGLICHNHQFLIILLIYLGNMHGSFTPLLFCQHTRDSGITNAVALWTHTSHRWDFLKWGRSGPHGRKSGKQRWGHKTGEGRKEKDWTWTQALNSHGSGQQATHGTLSLSLGFSFIKGSYSYNGCISLQGGDFHERQHMEGPKACIKNPFVVNEYYHWQGLILPLNLFTFITTPASLSPSSEEIKNLGHNEKGHSFPARCATLVALYPRGELW